MREREKEGGEREFGERNQDISPRCSWALIMENDIRILVPGVETNFVYMHVSAGVLDKVAPVWESVLPPCFSRSYVRGFENGRRSYELALEDNYDGDPRTAIYYALT